MAGFASFKKYIGIKGPSAKKATRGASEIRPVDFAQLIVSMSRLLNKLDAQPALAKQKLGIAEWVSLTLLATDQLTTKQLSRKLGVTGRRAREIVAALQRSGKISYSDPAAKGAGGFRLTEAGTASLAAVNGELMPSLAAVLKGRERLLISATKQMRLLMRITDG